MGIEFLSVSAEHREILRSYVSKTLQRPGDAAYSRARRVPRIAHRVKVNIHSKDAEGKFFREHAETLDVSDAGARIVLQQRLLPGELLALQVVSVRASPWAQFRAVWQGAPTTPAEGHVGLELLFVDFWGLHKLGGQ